MKAILAVMLVASVAIVSMFAARTPYPVLFARHVPSLEVVNDRGEHVQFRSESARAFVIFGYTRCHDACPLQLGGLARGLMELPPRMRPRVLFITIDPEYDSPPVLAGYLENWGGLVEGITGSPQTIRRIYEAFTGAPGLPSVADDHDSQIFAADALGEVTEAPDPGSRAFVTAARSLAKER
ncbi:MAG: SCO family protein [bacterium]|nr:SCO family protein [bacterium]